jgi:quinol monooxygenase YgiN
MSGYNGLAAAGRHIRGCERFEPRSDSLRVVAIMDRFTIDPSFHLKARTNSMKYARLIVPLLFALFWTPANVSALESEAGPRVHHVVIVWLKAHGNSAARQQYIAATKTLAALPMVSSYKIGTPMPVAREVVDSSYDLAITATFANAQALADYLKHPDHEQTLHQQIKPLVDRILVYDFEEAS